MKHLLLASILLLGLCVPLIVPLPWARGHSGGLDSCGCHAGSQPYHCHRDLCGRSRSRAPAKGKIKVVTVPRARVYIDGEFVGVSPTKALRRESGTLEVRLEHVAKESATFTTEVSAGTTTTTDIRW